MAPSDACLNLIKRFESLRLESYLCPAGIPTVGYGHTRGVVLGVHITEALADELLREDVERVAQEIPYVFRPPLPYSQNKYDALISLAFNVGTHRLPAIAPKLVAAINSGRIENAADEFLDINKAGGHVLAGLTERRKAERALFLSQTAEAVA